MKIDYETYERKIQRAGQNGCQVRVPFLHNFKKRLRPQDYARADLHKINDGIYILEFKIKRGDILTTADEFQNQREGFRWF